MDLVSDLAIINTVAASSAPSVITEIPTPTVAEQISPNATTSSASIENLLANASSTSGLSMLPPNLDETNMPGGDEKEDRPSLSYKDLIIEAIESSPEKRLKLSEIYQVIKYLHPYYRKRPDQWGWQNSIRHNLSLHDCFVKLPLKQSSASGVVGHFWTVVRDREEKNGSSRRRNRGSTNRNSRAGCKISNASAPATTSHGIKGKDRQSVSSDSGVLSDDSQSSSPTSGQLGSDYNPFLANASTYANLHFASPLHRPMPSYTAPAPVSMPGSPTKSLLDGVGASSNLLPLLGRLALQSLADNNGYGGQQNPLASSLQRLQLLQLLYQQNLLQQIAEEQASTLAAQQASAQTSPVTALLAQLLANSTPGLDSMPQPKPQSQSLVDLLLQSASLQAAASSTSISPSVDPTSFLSGLNSTPNLATMIEQQLRNNVAMTSPTPSAKDVVMI